MNKLKGLEPEKVFEFFEEISSVPRGSGDMEKISEYCVSFAEKRGLRFVRDKANNVVVFKDGTEGYENSGTVILQGHLDMVCQKREESEIDFLTDGIELIVDGDFISANGTTLGADNGIAVAMILAILDSDDIPHPPVEAVFTTDEEIGMIGAFQLDMSVLKGRKMINIDAEEDGILTVSCAGGSDLVMTSSLERREATGTVVEITLKGLKGGHSGVEIHDGRVNADILAGRVLNHMKGTAGFSLISVNGGDKGNAIVNLCKISVLTNEKDAFTAEAEKYLDTIKEEISEREPGFEYSVVTEEKTASVLSEDCEKKVIFALGCVPNGVVEMSKEIDGLVETSLNLGILRTEEDRITLHFTLRSNKKSALSFLEEKLTAFADFAGFRSESFGHYPPWEFNGSSSLQQIYKKCFEEINGYEPRLEAIHAGLECGVFATYLDNLDCVALGPAMWDVHTVSEKLSVSSTERTFCLIKKMLENCK